MITITLEFETREEALSALEALGGNDATTTKPARKTTRKASKAKATEPAGPTPEPAAEPAAAPAAPVAEAPAGPAATEAPAAPAATPAETPAAVNYTIEQVRARVGQLAQVMPDQGASLGQILQQAFGVSQLPDLDPAHYGTFVRQCEAHAKTLGVQV